MAINPAFVNGFQKGSEENANIGFGNFVGVETYTTKGVAKLTRDTTNVGLGVITDLIISFANLDQSRVFAQGNTGKVYKSMDAGQTWTDISPPILGDGNGIIAYQGFIFAFRGGNIDYLSTPYGAGNWTQNWQTGNEDAPTTPIIFPNDNALYFSNGNKMGKIFFGTAPSFNPGGSATTTINYSNLTGGTFSVNNTITDSVTGATAVITFDNGANQMMVKNITPTSKGGFNISDTFTNSNGVSAKITSFPVASTYFYQPDRLILPSLYQISCISFLPTNFLALGTFSLQDSQVADVILWNPTLSTYETPLRLYSSSGGLNTSGVKQIINRNNVLYAVTGGSQCVFSTNGSTFRQVEDLSLFTSWRTAGGAQAPFRVFLDPQPEAIAILGNKLLTGTTKGITPHSPITGFGLFPMGVWTLAFQEDGSTSTQLEFPISTGTVTATNPFTIGAIQATIQNQALIGWQDNASFGIDLIDLDRFQTDINTVIIESPMFEIGTPLTPSTVQNIEVFLVNDLLPGQTISIYARTGFNQDFVFLQSFDPAVDGILNQYKVTQNPIGAAQYFQLRVQMSTGSPNAAFTQQLRNVKIS